MTNANVTNMVKEKDGETLMVKYKDGEKKVIVTPQTVDCRRCAERREKRLRPGAQIIIFGWDKQTGRLGAGEIAVYRPQRDAGDVMFKTDIFDRPDVIIVASAAGAACATAGRRYALRGTVEQVDGRVLTVKSRKPVR